ncbi:MAG: protein kinase, partial [Bacteroidetes bacterium]|nr:protein kinase [Bacteroidota bacterium]
MIGTTLSHYRIVEELGRGGMGIVYKAEDTKLDRTVAIKVLPSAALASKDDRERFYREAKAAAALNHPHIAQVYEIDEAVPSDAPHGTAPSPFIAMEFIDGRPLDEELKDRPLKLEKAVALAIQIAQALETAHEKHIVHRDIKSANVMLTAKGQAKVLDFGLAKTSHSTMLTRMGSTLGTVAYMSPEQARGEDVDHRSDLWALGVVLYEMVSGKNPFGGDYEQAVVYSILNEAPEPLTAVRTGVPMQLEWIVNKCLSKSADDRYQSAKDLIVDLRKVDTKTGSGANPVSRASMAAIPAVPAPTQKKPWAWIVGALLMGVLLTAGIMTVLRPKPDASQLTLVDLTLESLFFVRFPAFSPTGQYLAVQAINHGGQKGLFLRTMSTGELSFIKGSENAGDREMGFSPDGSRLAYNAASNAGLYVMDVPAGIPVQLTEFGRFAYWESTDVIVMTDDRPGGGPSHRVRLDDGEPQLIEVADPKLAEGFSNVLKTNVPGTSRAFGHQLVRTTGGNQDVSQASNVYAFDAKKGEVTIIAQNAINP